MRRVITIDLVKKEFTDRGYELLSTEYKNNITPLYYICPKHRDKGAQTITFASFTIGCGCIYCSGTKKRTQKEYEQDLYKENPNIKVLEEYKGLKTKIEHECLICGHKWKVKPTNLLHLHYGCPRCRNRNTNRTQEEFIQDVNKINPMIKVLGEYKNTTIKIKFECLKCGCVWEAKPNNILSGKGCPSCRASKGEIAVKSYLDNNNIKYKYQHIFKDCKYERYLVFDFYLPEYNICIEYDGKQHFEPCRFGGISQEQSEKVFELCKIKDGIKTQYCKDKNIRLLRISYLQYENIDNIISSFLIK